MLIHYLREKNDVITNVKGSYLSSTGPLRGVLVSDAAGRVGWSKWNEKSEKREWVIDQTKKWVHNGMAINAAVKKAERTVNRVVRMNKDEALAIAISRLELSEMQEPPDSIEAAFQAMVDRSYRFYRGEKNA